MPLAVAHRQREQLETVAARDRGSGVGVEASAEQDDGTGHGVLLSVIRRPLAGGWPGPRIMSMRLAGFVLLIAGGAAACSQGNPADTLVGTAPDVTVTLAPGATASAEPPTLVIPRTAAQVGLRLTGEMGELEHLTAEVAPANAPDDARRWRVDAAPPGG